MNNFTKKIGFKRPDKAWPNIWGSDYANSNIYTVHIMILLMFMEMTPGKASLKIFHKLNKY